MKGTRFVIVSAISLALLGSSAALAATTTTTSVDQARLEAASKQLAIKAGSTKGAPQQNYLQERKRVDNLIDQLERGQHVDPADVERGIDRANSAPY